MKLQFVGDACISLVFGEDISLETSNRVLAAYQRLRRSRVKRTIGVLDLVPTYRSLAVHLRPGTDPRVAGKELAAFFARQPEVATKGQGTTVELPVVYAGPDLERVAQLHKLSVAEVISIHCGGVYRVAMVGFRPHFPYLIGLDPRLETPRLDSPRIRVPAGTVGIGGAQTGIYPEESPGGWNLIGQTDPKLLRSILPGDTIRFRGVAAL